MEAMGVLKSYNSVLCHDHWSSYYSFVENAEHSLCNAHHLRELTWSFEEDKMAWAGQLFDFLQELNIEVLQAGGALESQRKKEVREAYREILNDGEITCPGPLESERKPGQRGRQKRSKSRNLLERLRAFEDDTLRFMTRADIPFTNNQSERDLRMAKVQQKISGCFHSDLGARCFVENAVMFQPAASEACQPLTRSKWHWRESCLRSVGLNSYNTRKPNDPALTFQISALISFSISASTFPLKRNDFVGKGLGIETGSRR